MYPELSLLDLAEPFGRRLIKERFHPERMQKRWWRQLTGFVEAMAGFPRQASQLAALVRTGKLKVEIGIPEIELLLRKLDQISNRITISIVLLCFSIIMVGLIIASSLGKVPALILHFPVMEVGSTVAGLMFFCGCCTRCSGRENFNRARQVLIGKKKHSPELFTTFRRRPRQECFFWYGMYSICGFMVKPPIQGIVNSFKDCTTDIGYGNCQIKGVI